MKKDFMCPICNSAPLITDYCPNCSRIEGHTAPPDAFPQAHRLALELECLLLSCQDNVAVSKWWDSAHEALEQWRKFCAGDPPAVDSHWPNIKMDISERKTHPAIEPALSAARSLTDELMDCVDRLGSEYDTVDPRVWEHILVYAKPVGAAPLPDDVAQMVEALRRHEWVPVIQQAAEMIERLARERDQAVIRRDEIAHSLRREEVERLARQVPPDCVVVPREPTEAMLDAVLDERLNALMDSRPHTLVDIYKAMIAAGERI